MNDDNDPHHLAPAGFKFSELDFVVDNIVLPLRKELEKKRRRLHFNLCYVAFTSQNAPGTSYHHSSPSEYGEFIRATYLHLKAKYGIEPDSLTVSLEPDSPNNGHTPSWWTSSVFEAVQRLQDDFRVRIKGPEVSNVGNAMTYLLALQASHPIILQKHFDAVTFHRYGGLTSAQVQTLRNFASPFGIPVEQTEWMWGTPDTHHQDLARGVSMSNSLYSLASDGIDDLIQIDASDPNDVQVLPGAQTRYFQHYFRYVRRGYTRIATGSASANLKPVAFIKAGGDGTVIVVRALAGEAFCVQGLPAGIYAISYNTAATYAATLPDQELKSGGLLTTAIPAAGVISIRSRKE